MNKINISKKGIEEASVHTFQAILKGVPVIGSSLDHLIFGQLQEIRIKKIEKLLHEVAAHLQDVKYAPSINSEKFAILLEEIIQRSSKETNQEKLNQFKHILINGASLEPNDDEWDEFDLILEIMDELDGLSFFVLSKLYEAYQMGKNLLTVQIDGDIARLLNEKTFAEEWELVTTFDNNSIIIERSINKLYKLGLIETHGAQQIMQNVFPPKIGGRTSAAINLGSHGHFFLSYLSKSEDLEKN